MSKDVTSLLVMWYLFADINLFSKVSFFFGRTTHLSIRFSETR